jgi:SAM-dependent methyltransferase
MFVSEKKQVDKAHYSFVRYMQKDRWASFWHQLDELFRLNPNRALEIGPGPGVFKLVANQFGVTVETLDLDSELNPDCVGSVLSLPFPENTYDVVCAFQMLEHVPYAESLLAFQEMVRVSRKNVIISLPDAKIVWPFRVHIPKIGEYKLLFPRPVLQESLHYFNGEHYWEINKRGFNLKRIIKDFGSICRIIKTYRVFDNPYHRFFVFEKAKTF